MAILLTLIISILLMVFIAWTLAVSAVPLIVMIVTAVAIALICVLMYGVGFGVYYVKNKFKINPINYYDQDDYNLELEEDLEEIMNKFRKAPKQ